jgi:hypothetical protein
LQVAAVLHDSEVMEQIQLFLLEKFSICFSSQTLKVLNLSFNGMSAKTAEDVYELFRNNNVTIRFAEHI